MTTYDRRHGGITLTSDQLDQLDALYNTQFNIYKKEGHKDDIGLGAPLYDMIFNKTVTGTEVSPRIRQQDQQLAVDPVWKKCAHGAVFKATKPTKTADPCAPVQY
ncbi:hypothetical protein [Oleiagrimonas sp. MCCC 1A03011]|uniref:hypothetical protein n=1 Tax=Oleiagrimonas sp. MCCC 1A03011 TaxID=1926883 RepID=UPI0011BF5733|nr:hypothetical protein [Oleiagrimonas sp. MCCC 1A03011]